MSYVLDALKKTEAEQDPKAAATLTLYQHRTRRQRLVGVVVALALAGNAAALLWLARPSDPGMSAAEPARAASPAAGPRAPAPREVAPAEPAPSATAAAPPAVPAPVPAASASAGAARPALPADATTTEPIPAVPAPHVAEVAPVTLGQLPAAVRARLPGLVFSTHVFADDPSLRAVVANGRRLTEGDTLEGVRIAHITEEGVTLGFEGYLVAIPVIADWDLEGG